MKRMEIEGTLTNWNEMEYVLCIQSDRLNYTKFLYNEEEKTRKSIYFSKTT